MDIFAIDKGDGKSQARLETLSKRVTEHVLIHDPMDPADGRTSE